MRLPRPTLSIAWTAAIAGVLLLGGLAIRTALAGEPAPLSTAQPDPAIRERIRGYEMGTARGSSDLMSFTGPDDRPVYLFTAPCCDRYNPLYDAEGRFICAPTGGIAGRGDGKCPYWVSLRNPRPPAFMSAQPSASRETP